MSVNLDDVRLFVTMPLLYRHERLHHWMAQIRELAELDVKAVHFHVITNTTAPINHSIIRACLTIMFDYILGSDDGSLRWRRRPRLLWDSAPSCV